MSIIEASKQKKKKSLHKHQFVCTAPVKCNEKSLMKLYSVSTKAFETFKCLPKILFNLDIMDLFTALFLFSF